MSTILHTELCSKLVNEGGQKSSKSRQRSLWMPRQPGSDGIYDGVAIRVQT